MRNLLALVGAAAVAFLALGWYLGWYQVSSKTTPGGKQGVQVDIHPEKITTDVKKGVDKGGEIVDQIREKKGEPASGPATNFFTPTSTEKPSDSSGGWNPISKPKNDDSGAFGFRLPKN